MKKMGIIILTVALCLVLCACDMGGKFGFSEKLFEGDGIYQEFDDLSQEEQDAFVSQAVKKGYSPSFDEEGRTTLTKDGKTLILGRGRSEKKPEKVLFSEALFNGDGTYQEYDKLSQAEQEEFLAQAADAGYTPGFSADGRITLTKGGKTFTLGESKASSN